MPDLSTLLMFSGAVVLLAMTPGPDMALILGRGVGQGPRVAVFTAVGFFLAGAVQIPLLALGIASIVASSPVLFDVLRYAGGAYLVWKGLRMLRGSSAAGLPTQSVTSPQAALREGMIASLLNPKGLAFQLAFLPQFVDPSNGPVAVQFAVLGVTMRVVALVVETMLALFSGIVGRGLSRHPRIQLWQSKLTGIVIVGLGLRLFVMEGPETRS